MCLLIRRLIRESGLPELRFAVELLARECLNNAVIHGHNSGADKSVDLTLSIVKKWVRLEVRDEGAGFAWRKECEKRPGTIECCGRGLHICALYAEHVRFNRRGNHIVLWIRTNE